MSEGKALSCEKGNNTWILQNYDLEAVAGMVGAIKSWSKKRLKS